MLFKYITETPSRYIVSLKISWELRLDAGLGGNGLRMALRVIRLYATVWRGPGLMHVNVEKKSGRWGGPKRNWQEKKKSMKRTSGKNGSTIMGCRNTMKVHGSDSYCCLHCCYGRFWWCFSFVQDHRSFCFPKCCLNNWSLGFARW